MAWVRCRNCATCFDRGRSANCVACGYFHPAPAVEETPEPVLQPPGEELATPAGPPEADLEAKRDGSWLQWFVAAALLFLIFAPSKLLANLQGLLFLLKPVGILVGILFAVVQLVSPKSRPPDAPPSELPTSPRPTAVAIGPSAVRPSGPPTVAGLAETIGTILAYAILAAMAGGVALFVFVYVVCVVAK